MTGGRNLYFEGPKTWASALGAAPEKDRFGQAPSSTRGYIKLSNAAKAFNFDFRGKTVLDIGSSTGGFTKYALDHGAKKVIAVEKGTNQMMSPLRFDPRIELHEKTDIFDFTLGAGVVDRLAHEAFSQSESVFAGVEPTPAERAPYKDGRASGLEDENKARAPEKNISGTPTPDIILADISFLSLKKVLSYAKKSLAGKHTEFLVMLKPQFEAKPTELTSGVVKNEKIRREIIKNFEQWLKQNNFLILKKRDNTLKGKTGNLERFYYLKLEK